MINEGNLSALLPLLIFMGFMVAIGFWVRRQNAGKNFVQSYFIGNHDLGGFVLAMTTVATYSSVSSFVGGPGMAWQIGFGWVYMAVVQVTAIFLVLGIFGKRVAMLSTGGLGAFIFIGNGRRYHPRTVPVGRPRGDGGVHHRAVLLRHDDGTVRRRREALRDGHGLQL